MEGDELELLGLRQHPLILAKNVPCFTVTITLWGIRAMRKILIAFAVLVTVACGTGLSIGAATPAHADYVKAGSQP